MRDVQKDLQLVVSASYVYEADIKFSLSNQMVGGILIRSSKTGEEDDSF